jgi:hypothetical protein
MSEQMTLDVLNQLLALHSRSLPTYLACARPWFPKPDSEAESVLRHIAEDHKLMIDRIGTIIMDLGGTISASEFPMEFTDMHDLSVDYLVPQIITRLEQDVAWMRQCVPQLNDVPAARAIAEESLGAAQAHRDSLNELTIPA